MTLTPPPVQPAPAEPPVPGKNNADSIVVALTTAIWVTAATIFTAVALAIVSLFVFDDQGSDGWGIIKAAGVVFGVGIVGGYLLWSTVAIVRKRSRIRSVLAGVVLVPGLIGISVLWHVVSESSEAAKQQRAELILNEFKRDVGIEETERDSSRTFSTRDCTIMGKATSKSFLASHEAGFELITEAETALVDQGWKTTTGLWVSHHTDDDIPDYEIWAVIGIRNNDAIVYEMRFGQSTDGGDYTFGKTDTYTGSCVKNMDATDLYDQFSEPSPLPEVVPDLFD